ncbi:hypothetical protein GCM10027053_46420 [Intrasporangium mesophilum]
MFSRTLPSTDLTDAQSAVEEIGDEASMVPLALVLPEVGELGITTLDALEAHIGHERVRRVGGLVRVVPRDVIVELSDQIAECRRRLAEITARNAAKAAELAQAFTAQVECVSVWQGLVTETMARANCDALTAQRILDGDVDSGGRPVSAVSAWEERLDDIRRQEAEFEAAERRAADRLAKQKQLDPDRRSIGAYLDGEGG